LRLAGMMSGIREFFTSRGLIQSALIPSEPKDDCQGEEDSWVGIPEKYYVSILRKGKPV
jgi:hypothetical protein